MLARDGEQIGAAYARVNTTPRCDRPVDVRAFVELAAGVPQIVPAQVVHEEEDDVGMFRAGGRGRIRGHAPWPVAANQMRDGSNGHNHRPFYWSS